MQAHTILARYPFVRERLRARNRFADAPASAAAPFDRRGREDRQRTQLETELMALFRDGGGERAFEALYEVSRGDLLVWIMRCLRGRCDLDPLELLQDTYVNVYRYAQGFRDEKGHSFRVWVHAIASNVVRRAMTRRAKNFLPEVPEGLHEPEDTGEGPAQAAQGREDSVNLKRAWMILLCQYARAWEELSERDREALHLVEVEGLPYAEASRRLGVGLSNMKMIIFRARKRIRRSMLCDMQMRPAARTETTARAMAG